MSDSEFSKTLDLAKKLTDFSGILDDLEGLSDKKKKLYLEIYENAIIDRQNAYMMFLKLAKIAGDKSTEHAVHARALATYIERMSKANDQLIKLSELIEKAGTKSDELTTDEIFDRINANSKKN